MTGLTQPEVDTIEALDFPVECDLDSNRAAVWMVVDCCNRHVPLCSICSVSITMELHVDTIRNRRRACKACGVTHQPIAPHIKFKPIGGDK